MRRLLLFSWLVLLAGCVPDGLTDFDFQDLQPPAPPDELTGDVLVGVASDGGLTVTLAAARGGPHLGYVRLGLSVEEAGATVTTADVTLRAVAEAGPAAGVALPIKAPAVDAEGVYRGAAFLLAPDTTVRRFTISATIRANGKMAEVAFPVEARNDLWMQPAGDLLVSWVDPLRPVVGVNRFEVAVHRWTGAAFEPVDGADADLTPYMDMGGGDGHSTPFGDFAALGDGRYAWEVDFIMSGGWEMTVFVTPAGASEAVATFVGYTVYEPEVEA
jgi:hypothetical protein